MGGSKNVFIGGFSQGCAVSLASFLLYKGMLGGVVGLSGCQAAELDWTKIDLLIKTKTPLFLYHGEDDPVVPEELAIHSYEMFRQKKV